MNAIKGNVSTEQSTKDRTSALPPRFRRQAVVALLLIHIFLLGYSGQRNSWTWDEVAFLPAGISHWKFGDFELFDVNPPLVRMVAALPVLFADPKLDWEGYTTNPTVRPERPIGERFLRNNGERSFWLLTLARCACIPFSLLGGFVCYHWSRQLFGDASGLLALFLWTFSPTIIAHGQLITADVGGTSLGILGFYVFWKWLHEPSWRRTLLLGGVMGILEFTKSTWIILFGMWPVIWLLWRFGCRAENQSGWLFREGRRLSIAFILAMYILNLGYGFQGTGKRLGDYEFISTAIGGLQVPGEEKRGQISGYPGSFQGSIRNQFTGTLLGSLPVPLPQKYVEGMDRQKFHFESDNWAYLGGEWKEGGWLYYYLYAIAVKTPHGTWLVMLVALIGAVAAEQLRGRTRDNLFLGGTMILLLTFVSLQTGINRHVRYALPAFPFAFILASRAGLLITRRDWRSAVFVATGCCWLTVSSLTTFPYHLSYFNELAGGPKNGGKHLSSSNVDWGQDLLHLKKWLADHPDVELDGLGWHCRVVDPVIAGIKSDPVPKTPTPGWYAVSLCQIHQQSGNCRYFEDLKPVAWAGCSIPIFHITVEDADRLNASSEFLSPDAVAVSIIAETKLESDAALLFVAYSSPSRSIITGTSSGAVTRRGQESLSNAIPLTSSSGRARSGTFSTDARKFIVGWSDGTVKLFNDLNSVPLSLTSDVGSIRAVDLSSDGRLLAIAGDNGVVELRSTDAPHETIARLKHDLPVLTISFAENGTRIATGTGGIQTGDTGSARLWDTATGMLIRQLPHCSATVKAMSTSPDGRIIAGRGDGDSIQLWSVLADEPQQSLPDSEQVMFTQFTSDGRHIVGGDYRGFLKVWNVRSRQLVLSKRAHIGMVSGGCCIGDSGILATGGADGLLKLWDASSILGTASGSTDHPIAHVVGSSESDQKSERLTQ